MRHADLKFMCQILTQQAAFVIFVFPSSTDLISLVMQNKNCGKLKTKSHLHTKKSQPDGMGIDVEQLMQDLEEEAAVMVTFNFVSFNN